MLVRTSCNGWLEIFTAIPAKIIQGHYTTLSSRYGIVLQNTSQHLLLPELAIPFHKLIDLNLPFVLIGRCFFFVQKTVQIGKEAQSLRHRSAVARRKQLNTGLASVQHFVVQGKDGEKRTQRWFVLSFRLLIAEFKEPKATVVIIAVKSILNCSPIHVFIR